MKVSTVFGILPVFIRESDDIPGMGQARGPFIRLRPNAGTNVLEHELVHVKQWYTLFALFVAISLVGVLVCPWAFLLMVPPVVFWNIEPGEFVLETAAYAKSARVRISQGWDPDEAIDTYARIYDTKSFYKENRSLDEIKNRIRKRVKDGWIF